MSNNSNHERNIENTLTKRSELESVMSDLDGDFVAIVGACATHDEGNEATTLGVTTSEIERVAELSDEHLLHGMARLGLWKPRTTRSTWRGPFQTSPILTREIARIANIQSPGLAFEIGDLEQQSLIDTATMIWIGARSIENSGLHSMLVGNTMVPAAIKNGLDEDMEHTVNLVSDISRRRADIEHRPSGLSVMHRGGVSSTPMAWEDSVRLTDELVQIARSRGHNISLLIDVAHGGEMAHDPEGQMRKTVEGQKRALHHILEMKQEGDLGALKGVMVEASDMQLPQHKQTDPNIPFDDAIAILKQHIGKRQIKRDRSVEPVLPRKIVDPPTHKKWNSSCEAWDSWPGKHI